MAYVISSVAHVAVIAAAVFWRSEVLAAVPIIVGYAALFQGVAQGR